MRKRVGEFVPKVIFKSKQFLLLSNKLAFHLLPIKLVRTGLM